MEQLMKRLLLVLVALSVGAGVCSAATTNLALGATITSSPGHYGDGTPDKAIDGDYTTYWNAGDHGTSASPNWLLIDLGATKTVNQIDVLWQLPDKRYSNYTVDYNFYTGLSDIGMTLQKSASFVDERSPGPALPEDMGFTLDFGSAGISMRYAKFEAVDFDDDVISMNHWTSLSEIEIFGSDTDQGDQGGEPVPAPGAFLLVGLGSGLLGYARRSRAL